MMNAPRIAFERVPAAILFGRLTVPVSHSARPCQHLLRHLSYTHPRSASSEKLQPASPYQPYPLSRPPPQPRNDLIPETSIASPIPAVHETRPPKQPLSAASNPPSSATSTTTSAAQSIAGSTTTITPAVAAVSETEAQKTKPVAAPERKRKLRPRKAALKLTPSAVEQLRTLLDGPDPKLIKVGVRNRGCSGLAYHLEYVGKPGAFDEEVDQDGVKVLIDSKALFSIIGSEMDWVEDKLNQRFVFRNPNIKEECGCGESFMV